MANKLNNELKNKGVIDKRGHRYGKLTVIELAQQRKYNRLTWKCRCDCGEYSEVVTSNLRMGKDGSKSCGGCLERMDKTGEKYGKLTVFEKTEKKIGYNAIYKCSCECGNTHNVSVKNLNRGHTKSCGCLGWNLVPAREKSLKEGTHLGQIKSKKSLSSTGIRGVTKKKNGKYLAQIGYKNKNYNLGTYERIEDAIAARKAGEEKYYKPVLEKYGEEHN